MWIEKKNKENAVCEDDNLIFDSLKRLLKGYFKGPNMNFRKNLKGSRENLLRTK